MLTMWQENMVLNSVDDMQKLPKHLVMEYMMVFIIIILILIVIIIIMVYVDNVTGEHNMGQCWRHREATEASRGGALGGLWG